MCSGWMVGILEFWMKGLFWMWLNYGGGYFDFSVFFLLRFEEV